MRYKIFLLIILAALALITIIGIKLTSLYPSSAASIKTVNTSLALSSVGKYSMHSSGKMVVKERRRRRAAASHLKRTKKRRSPRRIVIEEPEDGSIATVDGKYIIVSKSRQLVSLYEDSETPTKEFPCSTGKTWPVVGTFHVYGKSPASCAPKYGLSFKYMTRFWKPSRTIPVGFHSLPYDRRGNVVDADKLGQPASHGCVRLNFEDAEFIYNWAPIGTRVSVVD